MYEAHILFDGYCRPTKGGVFANCTCTLLRGPNNIIVDTLTPWDKKDLVKAIEQRGVTCEDINYVVSTHGHSDHVGNNNLFLKAQHIVGRCVSYEQLYYDDSAFFNADGVYEIDENVRIVSTPGHTESDVSVIVRTVDGLIGVVGDLFEREEDIEDESIWLNAGSENSDLQRKNRNTILSQVDWIVPGHGPMFSTKNYKL
ncbi:metallo-beta-lactamase domain-containing protein 1 [Adelges cooleyi]|uniref:metallo-beta-lactamase domain-containing protein 1 n=1 Tax=Adelges cooleyi TaxID=133065 RepID=UPI00217FC2EB|nr:metallo-beta-lactamase domain-containing protein 1 [Adelges cooleyi]